MVRRPAPEHLSDSQRRVSGAIARRLREAGHQAWLVGGCVRDLALGRAPKDVDLCTDASPDRVEALFEHVVGVGRAFGTTVVADFGPGVEVTTFRSDGAYHDGRRPERVDYADSPEEDARRRDFTCNALYLDPLSGELRDPTGGLADLEAGRLVTVGDPSARFAEDSLRLLRLVRFAATHGLVPEQATLEAARAQATLLTRIARERVLHELCALFDAGDAGVGLGLSRELGLDGPALGRRLDERDVALARALPRAPGAACGLAVALAGPRVDGRTRTEAAERLAVLRPSRELSRAVDALLEGLALLAEDAPTARLVRRREGLDPRQWLALARAHAHADGAVDGPRVERLGGLLGSWPPERGLPAPLLDAAALMELGVPRGPRLGELLRELVDAQVEERVRDPEGARRFVAGRRRDEG